MADIDGALDRERVVRETVENRDVRLNLPVDVPRPASMIPGGFGVDGNTRPGEFHTRPIRDDEANIKDEIHPADLAGEFNDENAKRVEEMWVRIYGEECPYDFSDVHDQVINFELALQNLENGWRIEVSKVEGQVEVEFDWRGLGNEATRAFLKRKGDAEFVKKVWGGCTRISLCEPVAEDEAGWKIIIESGSRDKQDFMIISKSDFEDCLINGDGRTIELPRLREGSRDDRVKFIEALHKLRIGGMEMPPVVNVDVRMGVRFPVRTSR